MMITVNGHAHAINHACTVEILLATLGYHDHFVAVARNHEHVPRRDFDHTWIREGDEIEILAPMAGG